MRPPLHVPCCLQPSKLTFKLVPHHSSPHPFALQESALEPEGSGPTPGYDWMLGRRRLTAGQHDNSSTTETLFDKLRRLLRFDEPSASAAASAAEAEAVATRSLRRRRLA